MHNMSNNLVSQGHLKLQKLSSTSIFPAGKSSASRVFYIDVVNSVAWALICKIAIDGCSLRPMFYT